MNLHTKSPFLVVPEFLSPLLCEDIIDLVDFTVPNTNKDGRDVLTKKTSDLADAIIFERLQQIINDVQSHYDISYKGTEPMSFEWFPTGTQGELRAENSEYLRSKWVRLKPADLTGILFLSDYQDSPPFEQYYEVYGGKFEFPQHQFGLNPKRGTLVIFPSDPHFINHTTQIKAGDLYQVRFNIVATKPYFYNPELFPGNYTTWFK